MLKVVYNTDFGGFEISYSACRWLLAHGIEEEYAKKIDYLLNIACENASHDIIVYDDDQQVNFVSFTDDKVNHTEDELNILINMPVHFIPRHHPLLIECVETLGEKANGPCAKLAITKVMSSSYEIEDVYDGIEEVYEN